MIVAADQDIQKGKESDFLFLMVVNINHLGGGISCIDGVRELIVSLI